MNVRMLTGVYIRSAHCFQREAGDGERGRYIVCRHYVVAYGDVEREDSNNACAVV